MFLLDVRAVYAPDVCAATHYWPTVAKFFLDIGLIYARDATPRRPFFLDGWLLGPYRREVPPYRMFLCRGRFSPLHGVVLLVEGFVLQCLLMVLSSPQVVYFHICCWSCVVWGWRRRGMFRGSMRIWVLSFWLRYASCQCGLRCPVHWRTSSRIIHTSVAFHCSRWSIFEFSYYRFHLPYRFLSPAAGWLCCFWVFVLNQDSTYLIWIARGINIRGINVSSNLIPLIFVSVVIEDQAFPLLHSVAVRCIFMKGPHFRFGYPESIWFPSVNNSWFSVVVVGIVYVSTVLFFMFSLSWCGSHKSPQFGVVRNSICPSAF